jgi:phosphoribosylaminoimidazolecarboxamide formyltransferase/IMP cyclohydrolase
VHAGILAKREDEAHLAQIKEHGIETIDLVVSNLYPFEQVAATTEVITTLTHADGCVGEVLRGVH